MHPNNLKWLADVKTQYPGNFSNAKVLEIGAYNVNGTARDFFENCDYTGVDIVAGPCVDIVCPAGKTVFPPKHFDTFVALSVFEHDPDWRNSFSHNLQFLKPGALIVTCFGAEGNVHHEPEPWALVPFQVFLDHAAQFDIDRVDAFFEEDRYGIGCSGCYNCIFTKCQRERTVTC